MMSSTSTSASDVAGCGRLRVSLAPLVSVVTEAFASSPLRLLLPKNHGRAASVFASSFGGGMVDGDSVSIDLDVDAGVAAFLATQASTKVYRSARGAREGLRARVVEGVLLVVMPDPVVCF